MSDGRWRLSAVLLPCPQHETDRRTSRPSTGGASILRRDAGRRRSRQQLPDDGPPNATTEEQLKNNRIAHNERIAHHNRISNCFAATGRSRVGTSSGLAVSGAGQGAARRPFDSRAPLMRIRRRGAGAAAVMQLGCISSCGGSSRTSIHHARTSILSLVPLPVMQPKRITDGTSPLRRSVCITFTGTRSADKHDGFRQVSARHYRHVQHRTGTDHPSGARTRDPGRAATPSAPGSE